MVPSGPVPARSFGKETTMRKAEVVGVGNAIVDVIGRVDDAFIEQWDLKLGAMTLIHEPRAEHLTTLQERCSSSAGRRA